jgi:hypothetical protein
LEADTGVSPTEEEQMEQSTAPATTSKRNHWIGRILSGIGILFLVFDSVIHLLVVPPVVDTFNQLGFPLDFAFSLGLLELVCLTLYALPRTSVFGAILLTGYLGGAVAIQLRIHAPIFSTAMFPIYVGVLVWGGLFLRDGTLRALIPFRH